MAGRVPAVAPWLRTRLRTAPGAACTLALLVALTACLAAAFPRAVDRYEDAGLRQAVDDAGARRSTVQFYAPQPSVELPQAEREEALRPAALDRQYSQVRSVVERPFTVDADESSYGVRTSEPREVPDPWLPRPSGLPARIVLAAQNGLADHADLASGRFPRTHGTVTAATGEVEAAVTAETARSLRIEVGSVIHVPGVERAPLAVRVTGILTPRRPGGAYWAAQDLLREAALVRVPGGGSDPATYWLGALLLPPDAAPAVLGTAGNPWRYWQLAPDTSRLTAHTLPGLKSAIASLESGPGLREARRLTDPEVDASTDLDDVLTAYTRLRDGVGPLVAVAAFGTGTVAAVVLLMAGGLAADRRRAELALLRARGGSLPGVAGRLLAETAVVAVPAGALGLCCALLAVPDGRRSYAVAAAAAVTLLACAALPLRAALRHRTVQVHSGREDVATARPSRRRTVAELTLLVLAVGAVTALRRRGTSGGSGGVGSSASSGAGGSAASGFSGDELVSLAPVLIGVIAALVLVRLYPLPLRRLARPAGRLRGAVGHLSLARAGRASASTVLPLLALLTALTTAAFGGSVLAGVESARDRAALLATGADARVEGSVPLTDGLADKVRAMPGVREIARTSISYQAKPDGGPETVPTAGVDPESYARLARRTGLGAFPAGELRAGTDGSGQRAGTDGGGQRASGGGSSPLPALASASVAERHGTRPFPVHLEDGTTVTVRIALVRDVTPAVTGTEFLIVDRAGLGTEAARPTALLVTGDHLDRAALRKAAGATVGVRLRTDERAQYVDSPLQSGAERVYTTAVAAGAGYAVIALLLALVRAAPEQAALLARLRTMGLTRGQGRRLLVLEALPQALLAAVGGVLTGWAAVRLLSSGIDLTVIALASGDSPPGSAPLQTDVSSLLLPAAAVLALATGIAAVQAWWTGRRGSITELRAGDAR
ncbi:FtsX-like permease family protein [Streptomyces sp. NPDC059785]|uniref:FtsX-like permease family protein n=1 Tax=Streptomyces sp. NPDC059785 TaxID=3346945 RepID=UPI0036644A24